MTKAKARARAKARAAAKVVNPDTKSTKPAVKAPKGHFDAKSNSMRNIAGGSDVKTLSAMQRGNARSR